MRRLLFLALCASCATAGTEQPDTGTDAAIDASVIDARPDAPPPCNEIMTEVLLNPTFDTAPMGTMWMQQPANPSFPLITDQGQTGGTMGGITEQTAPYDAWLGGLAGTDILWQDFTVPLRTRLLTVSGFYEVRTGEAGATALDTASMAFVQTNDTPIAVAQSLDNTKKTTTWTTINYSVSNAETLSGMTIRLKMTATNNASAFTSFFWDTLSIKATHCMP